jgi:hypothetical protein
MGKRDRRVAITVIVSVLGAVIGVAGAGHAYLREWGRAFAWFSLVLGAGLVLIASFADSETVTLSTLPLRVSGPLLLLFTLNTLDAYRVASRTGGGGGVGRPTPVQDDSAPSIPCSSCGREYDPELSFCPWCAGTRDDDRPGER